jgi:hypothetical protein
MQRVTLTRFSQTDESVIGRVDANGDHLFNTLENITIASGPYPLAYLPCGSYVFKLTFNRYYGRHFYLSDIIDNNNYVPADYVYMSPYIIPDAEGNDVVDSRIIPYLDLLTDKGSRHNTIDSALVVMYARLANRFRLDVIDFRDPGPLTIGDASTES